MDTANNRINSIFRNKLKEPSPGGLPLEKNSIRPSVLYVYKDFDAYNGLIETFLILSKLKTTLSFDFEVCVFKNRIEDHARIFRANGGTLINIGARWGSNPLIILKLRKLFRAKRPNIVQSFILKPNLFGIIAARMAKVPVCIATDLTLKDQAPTRLRRLRDKFLYKIYAKVANKADHVVCVSEAGRKELKALGIRRDISVIFPPIDIDEIGRLYGTRMSPLLKPQNEVNIGIVARLSEEKRHADLLEAFANLSKKYGRLKLTIVGDGPLRPHLEAMSRRLNVDAEVCFKGFQYEVHKYLRTMDIFVLPSRTEGLPISIMEAMVWGLPVVASRVGGIPEIVDDQVTGILFDPGNVGQLCAALAQLIEAPEKRKLLGENGKMKADSSFHPDRFINSHFKLYTNLMNRYRLTYLVDTTKSTKKERGLTPKIRTTPSAKN